KVTWVPVSGIVADPSVVEPKVAETTAEPPVNEYVRGTACAAPVETSDNSPASSNPPRIARTARRPALIEPPLSVGWLGAAERGPISRHPSRGPFPETRSRHMQAGCRLLRQVIVDVTY